MLILTRKVDQAIVFQIPVDSNSPDATNGHQDVWVRVLRVERDRVKLGVDGPEEIVVLREELLGREPQEGTNSGDGEKPS